MARVNLDFYILSILAATRKSSRSNLAPSSKSCVPSMWFSDSAAWRAGLASTVPAVPLVLAGAIEVLMSSSFPAVLASLLLVAPDPLYS